MSLYTDGEENLRKQIEKFTKEAREIKDIFIVAKGGTSFNNEVLEVFDNVDSLLKYINTKDISKAKEYYLLEYLGWIKGFVGEKNKFLTFKTKRVWKYNRTLKLGRANDISAIEQMKKDEKVKYFLREKKLNRIVAKPTKEEYEKAKDIIKRYEEDGI